MNNFKKKALPAVLLLAGATASLGGVTYAWFSANAQVSASNYYVGITESTGGISISKTKDGEYAHTLDFSETATTWETSGTTSVPTAFKTTLFPRSVAKSSLRVATAAESDGDKRFDFYQAELDGTNLNNIKTSSKATDGFVKFNLWFENTTGSDQGIYFNYSNEEESMITEVFTRAAAASMSTRIAFINQGACATVRDEIVRPTVDLTESVIIEPNEKAHLDNAYVFSEDEDHKRTPLTGDDRKVVQPYWAINEELSNASVPMRPTYAEEHAEGFHGVVKQAADTVYKHNYGQTGATPLFTVPARKYSCVSVFIWIEGNDCDNLDNAAGSWMSMGLKFTTSATTPTTSTSTSTSTTSAE